MAFTWSKVGVLISSEIGQFWFCEISFQGRKLKISKVLATKCAACLFCKSCFSEQKSKNFKGFGHKVRRLFVLQKSFFGAKSKNFCRKLPPLGDLSECHVTFCSYKKLAISKH